MELQRAEPPLGGLNATPLGEIGRIFMSPGPIFEPEGRGADGFRFARALFAAGFRKGELVHNAFAYHLTPAGRIAESGAEALGCPVFPAGVGTTQQPVQATAALQPPHTNGPPSLPPPHPA